MTPSAFVAVARQLIEDLPGVNRLLLCSSDGLVTADTDASATSNSSAAAAAAVLGLGHHAARMIGHGTFEDAVIRSTDGCMVVHGVPGGRVLAAFCDRTVNVTLLGRKCRALLNDFDQD